MKFKTPKVRQLPEVNTAALPDIIFMLLFFFMVVTVMRDPSNEPKIDLPSVNYAELIKASDDYTILIKEESEKISYWLGQQSIKSLEELEPKLRHLYLANGPVGIKIKADKEIKMRHINKVKKLLQEVELYQLDYIVMASKR